MRKKPAGKDALLILAVLAVAAALWGASRLMPRRNAKELTAQATLAPDAVTDLESEAAAEPTAQPETTAEPTAAPEATAEPEATVEPAAAPEATAEPTAQPEATAEPEQAGTDGASFMGPAPRPQTDRVRGYVVLTVGGRPYGDPIPMDRDKIITVRQEGGRVNRVHITPDSAFMESSTCENQDCVGEGTVTLDNLDTRILGPYIICLPNEVTVEMVPAEETD